jgi:hypothetical protein
MVSRNRIEIFLRARHVFEFSHSQDPKQTWGWKDKLNGIHEISFRYRLGSDQPSAGFASASPAERLINARP